MNRWTGGRRGGGTENETESDDQLASCYKKLSQNKVFSPGPYYSIVPNVSCDFHPATLKTPAIVYNRDGE